MNPSRTMAIFACLLLGFGQSPGLGQDTNAIDATEIEQILKTQRDAWNRKDLKAFMATYWASPELTFSGGGNTTRGWQATLDRYLKSYPPEQMGTLEFNELEITPLGDSAALVLGRWQLEMEGGPKGGNFSLVLRKLNGEWKIIHDHSSTLDPEEGWLSVEQGLTVLRGYHRLADELPLRVKVRGPVMEVVGKTDSEEEDAATFWIDRRTGQVLTSQPADGVQR